MIEPYPSTGLPAPTNGLPDPGASNGLPSPGGELPLPGGGGVTAGDLLDPNFGFSPADSNSGLPSVDLPGGTLPIPGGAGETPESTVPVTDYRAPEGGRATITGRITPSGSPAGDTLTLMLKVTPDEGWHPYVFREMPLPPGSVFSPTLVTLDLPEGWQLLKDVPPTTQEYVSIREDWMNDDEPDIEYYKGAVDLQFPIKIPIDAAPGTYTISGQMGYQICSDTSCQSPRGIHFSTEVTVGPTTGMASIVQFTPLEEYEDVAKNIREQPQGAEVATEKASALDAFRNVMKIASESAAEVEEKGPVEYREDWTAGDLVRVLLMAFLGGLILNFMPCVLPVISLKLLALVQHSGEHRSRIFWLNAWYAAGLIFVFLVLATFAAVAGLSWGEQFTFDWFKISLIVLVFVMALSLMGVWEIPLPGFVGSGKVMELQQREGAVGSFVTGMVTTVLATPCSAPLLGPVFGFLMRQPPEIIYAIFGAVGLGMASPYLLIGINPKLIRFFPKPGGWMTTFKYLMGFLLLGTVGYLFMTVDPQWFVPTFILLIGCWFGCWWIGVVPLTASTFARRMAWIGGPLVAAATGWAAFTFLYQPVPKWQPIDVAVGEEAIENKQTVLLSFTADAAQRGLSNPIYALNTPEMRKWMSKNQPVLWVVDESTDASFELKKKLRASLGARPSSVVAFQLDKPDEPPKVFPYKVFDAFILSALAELDWVDFSRSALEDARNEGKTVMLDFTANWCPNCQVNLVTALETQAVSELVKRNGVVAMKADWTDRSPLIKNMLSDLGFNSIPLLVIYPPDGSEPVSMPDIITEGQVLKALEKAGPSKGFPKPVAEVPGE